VQEINLYELLKHYAKYWYFIVGATLLGLIAGLIYNNFIQVPLYKSNATLIVVNNAGTTVKSDTTLINNYQQLLKSRRVIEPVITESNINDSYKAVVGSVDTTNEKDTEVIKVSYSSTSPEQSQNVLNATIESFKNKIKDIYGKDNIQVVDGASISYEPYNVSKSLQLALASAVGLLSSIIILFFVYDYKLSTKDKPKSGTKRKPTILARYHAMSSAIRKTLKAKKQVRKAKRELKNQAKAQARKLAEIQKAIERKAEARKQATAKAIATKKAKAEMIAQAHRDEAERIMKIKQLKAKQIADAKKSELVKAEMIVQARKEEAERIVKLEELKSEQIADAKKLALAEAEAKKAEIIKQGIALKKAQDRKERREMLVAKIKSSIENTKNSMAEARKIREQQRADAQLEQAKQAKAEARKKAAAKARATKKAKAQQAKKAELDKQAAISRVAAIGKAKRAEQAAKYITNSLPAFTQSTKKEKK
jgi:capsular polysaccharide biosynthesis protein